MISQIDIVMCFIYNMWTVLQRYRNLCHSNIVTISECPLDKGFKLISSNYELLVLVKRNEALYSLLILQIWNFNSIKIWRRSLLFENYERNILDEPNFQKKIGFKVSNFKDFKVSKKEEFNGF